MHMKMRRGPEAASRLLAPLAFVLALASGVTGKVATYGGASFWHFVEGEG